VTSGLIIRQDARVGSQLDTNGSWFRGGNDKGERQQESLILRNVNFEEIRQLNTPSFIVTSQIQRSSIYAMSEEVIMVAQKSICVHSWGIWKRVTWDADVKKKKVTSP